MTIVVLPAGLSKEVISTVNAAMGNLPTAEQVVSTLKEQGIDVDYTSMDGTEMNLAAIEAWIASHSPAVILHRDAEDRPVHRRLQDNNGTNSTRELTEEEISSYQVHRPIRHSIFDILRSLFGFLWLSF